MPARRKTAGATRTRRPGRSKGSPDIELRTWAEDWVIRVAQDRYPTGFEPGSEAELVAFGTVLLELGGDPNRVVLDAAAAALLARCGKNGPPSARGRKADHAANRRQELGVRMVRVVAEMGAAAEGTRGLPEPDRLEEMAVAAAGELSRHFAASHEDRTGEKATEDDRAYWWTRARDASRDWIAAHPALARALLDRTTDRDGIPSTQEKLDEVAMGLLEDLGPLDLAEVPYLIDKLRSARASIGRRSKEARRKASVAAEALATK